METLIIKSSKILLKHFSSNPNEIENQIAFLGDKSLMVFNQLLFRKRLSDNVLSKILVEWPNRVFLMGRNMVDVYRVLMILKENTLKNITKVKPFNNTSPSFHRFYIPFDYISKFFEQNFDCSSRCEIIVDISLRESEIRAVNECLLTPQVVCNGKAKMDIRSISIACNGPSSMCNVSQPNKVLKLSFTNFLPFGIESNLPRFQNLTVLELVSCDVPSNFFSHFKCLPVRHVLVFYVNLSNIFSEFLSFLSEKTDDLQHLSLHSCNVSFEKYYSIFETCSKMPSIEYFSIIDRLFQPYSYFESNLIDSLDEKLFISTLKGFFVGIDDDYMDTDTVNGVLENCLLMGH